MFADIAGFTALTEAHGDLEAAQLVDDFRDSVRAEMAGGSGTLIKVNHVLYMTTRSTQRCNSS